MEYPILSILIVLPVVGLVPLLLFPAGREGLIRIIALAVTMSEFIVSLGLTRWFKPELAGMQFTEKSDWIPGLGVSYAVGLDGISLWLVLLTTFLVMVAVAGCPEYSTHHVRRRLIGILFFEAMVIGVFTALDAVLFCVFWEGALLTIYVMIGQDGDQERRPSAAMIYGLCTMTGATVMVMAILYLHSWYYRISGIYSFDLLSWYQLSLPYSVQVPVFLCLAIAFALQLPLIPFHGWLSDVHSKAPAMTNVIVAAVLATIGAYGFVRFSLPLFPEASLQFIPVIVLLGLLGIIYGGLIALTHNDGKRVVAFFSLSQMGLVMLGLFSFNQVAINGAVLLLISHGLCTAGLFCFIGMLENRKHSFYLSQSSGLIQAMPIGAAVFLIMTMASIGFPGLSGFVGQLLILLGTIESPRVGPPFVTLAALGAILPAAYLLRMFQQTMFGEITDQKSAQLSDLEWREWIVLGSIIFVSIWIGVYPKTFTARVDPAIQNLLTHIEQKKEDDANRALSQSTAEEVEVLQMIEDMLKRGKAE